MDCGDIELPSEAKDGQPIKHQTIKNYSLLQENKVMEYAFISSSEDASRLGQLKTALESAEGDDVSWLQWHINELLNQANLVSQLLQIAPTVDDNQIHQWCAGHLNSLTFAQRWMMYASWKRKATIQIEESSQVIEKHYRRLVNQMEEIRAKESAEICSSLDVVGITTTGAAKQRGFLDHLKSKIGTFQHFLIFESRL